MDVSVLIPTHNPDAGRLARTLAALRAQTLPRERWEIILVDNASTPPVAVPSESRAHVRIVREPTLGLTAARRRGFAEASTSLCVLVDDDNVLASDYLAHVVRLFAEHPRIGAVGGKSQPEFEAVPADWQREFLPLLALRDHGERAIVSESLRPPGAARNEFPAQAAPIGAGMAIRREAALAWSEDAHGSGVSDRRGGALSSAGDNDIVFAIMKRGWAVAYFPELVLTHLIPAARLAPDYLARLNRGIQRSWAAVLLQHDASPWPAISPWGARLRCTKAWWRHRPWQSPAAHVRWWGVCGHFEGRVRPTHG